MKLILVLFLVMRFSSDGLSQMQDIEQLQLDLEKLVQMKSILNSMYTGYNTLTKGYNEISGLAKGNFDLHKNFLDQLLQVASPVRNYPGIQSVLDKQATIESESQIAYRYYVKSLLFTADELLDIKRRVDKIKIAVVKELDHLRVVLTPGALRMSDQERISAIERIDKDVGGAVDAVRSLVKERNALAAQRGKRRNDINAMRSLYGLKN